MPPKPPQGAPNPSMDPQHHSIDPSNLPQVPSNLPQAPSNLPQPPPNHPKPPQISPAIPKPAQGTPEPPVWLVGRGTPQRPGPSLAALRAVMPRCRLFICSAISGDEGGADPQPPRTPGSLWGGGNWGQTPPAPMSHTVMVVGSEEGAPPNAWDPLWGGEEPLKSLWGWGGGPQTWVPQGSGVGGGPQILGTPPRAH